MTWVRCAGQRLASAGLILVVAATLSVGASLLGAESATGTEQSLPDGALLSTCTACHGKDGNSSEPLTPKIAGQKASYLRTQFRAFRSGARKSETMSAIASTLTNDQISDLARYFSHEPVRSDDVDNARLAALGKRVFLSGERGVPACASCHGSQGSGGTRMMMGGMGMGRMGMGRMGMMRNTANTPNLDGQRADYTVEQLEAFASGERSATVMDTIARQLSGRDRKAVAAYIAGLR